MPNAFVFSAANPVATKHYADTVETGVPLTRIYPLIHDREIRAKLEAAYDNDLAYCWGGKSGGYDERYVNTMVSGDLILGYRNKTIVCASYFVAKMKNAEVGKSLWPDAIDRPFDLVYFFTEPELLNQSTDGLRQYFAQVYQGLRRLPTSGDILRKFGSFSNFVRDALGGLGASTPDASMVDDSVLQALGVEGRRRLHLHWVIERKKSIVEKAKLYWKQQDRNLRCECCNFSFVVKYGEAGADFIEAHHRIPLADLALGSVRFTRVEDFAPLCANCHRIIHRRNLTVEELRLLVAEHQD